MPQAYSVSLWVKPEAAAGKAGSPRRLVGVLRRRQTPARRWVLFKRPAAVARQCTWAHVAVTVGASRVDRVCEWRAVGPRPILGAGAAIDGPLVVGEGVKGLVDELEVASTVRSADWIKLAAAAQKRRCQAGGFGHAKRGSADAEEGASQLLRHPRQNLTVDAWVVIIILGIMFAVAAWVMAAKAMLVGRADRDNQQLPQALPRCPRCDDAGRDGLQTFPLAPCTRQACVRLVRKRDVGKASTAGLSGASIDAVKAAIDADLVREPPPERQDGVC